MKDLEKTMASVSGTVFLYCSPKDAETISRFTSAAEHTGRRLVRREDCQALHPETLAERSAENVIFAAPSMLDFLDRYLEACPAQQRHLLLHVHGAREAIRSMSFVFHDFWEERHVSIEDLCTER